MSKGNRTREQRRYNASEVISEKIKKEPALHYYLMVNSVWLVITGLLAVWISYFLAKCDDSFPFSEVLEYAGKIWAILAVLSQSLTFFNRRNSVTSEFGTSWRDMMDFAIGSLLIGTSIILAVWAVLMIFGMNAQFINTFIPLTPFFLLGWSILCRANLT